MKIKKLSTMFCSMLCLIVLPFSISADDSVTDDSIQMIETSAHHDPDFVSAQMEIRSRIAAIERNTSRSMKKEALAIQNDLSLHITEDMLSNHYEELSESLLPSYQKKIDIFRQYHAGDDSYLRKPADDVISNVEQTLDAIPLIPEIDTQLALLYDPVSNTIAEKSVKNDRIFQKVQALIWKIPRDNFPWKIDYYNNAISKISDDWHYLNDDWHYETGTLKVSVEALTTPYHTNYYLAHIETFSIQQVRSALCGGTYGNPRKTTSEELRAHNAVIGVNGSAFDYGSGIPAPGKSMIKNETVYNDTYSNGNIMCITEDGGMFTALAGMPTDDMISQGVTDTFCFGPTLVENGEPYEINDQFHETYRYQRAAIGMVNPGNYYIMCCDGKGAGGSSGFDYVDMQQLFMDLGCKYAYNLDGGGSTTMIFKGRAINMLTDNGHERAVGDVLYFIDVGDGAEGDEIVIHDDEAIIESSGNETSTTSIWK